MVSLVSFFGKFPLVGEKRNGDKKRGTKGNGGLWNGMKEKENWRQKGGLGPPSLKCGFPGLLAGSGHLSGTDRVAVAHGVKAISCAFHWRSGLSNG